MTDYLKAARNTNDPATRRRFTRLHIEGRARTAITTCTNCPLSKTRINAVPWSGPTTARIVLLGEAPGALEDKQGVPFVGASGRVLNSALKTVGLDRDEVMVMNTICCRPPKNRDPKQVERTACHPHFVKQLSLTSAYVGVLMGNQAYGALTGEEGFRIGELRGRPIWFEGRVWIPTYHPAYVARNRDARGLLVNDLMLAKQITTSSNWWPLIDPADITTLGEDESRVKIEKRLKTKGWVQIYSAKLQDVIVVAEHGDVRVPSRLNDRPVYTLEELVKLGEGSRTRKMTVGDLRKVHLVKAVLGGRVVT